MFLPHWQLVYVHFVTLHRSGTKGSQQISRKKPKQTKKTSQVLLLQDSKNALEDKIYILARLLLKVKVFTLKMYHRM